MSEHDQKPKDPRRTSTGKERKKKLPPDVPRLPSGGARPGAGRPPGSRNVLPYGAVKAIRAAKFRVRKEYLDDPKLCDPVTEVAGYSFERTVQVLAGTIHSRKAPSVLKAAVAVREELCEPVVKETKFTGSISIADAVAQAAGKVPKGK